VAGARAAGGGRRGDGGPGGAPGRRGGAGAVRRVALGGPRGRSDGPAPAERRGGSAVRGDTGGARLHPEGASMRLGLTLLQRLAGFVIVFYGVTFIICLTVFSLRGDRIRAVAGDRQLPQTVVDAINARYLLDQPLWVQYTNYLGNLLSGDLGVDLRGRSVSDQLADRWPVTIVLALTAWTIQIILGLAVGIVSALRRGTIIDRGLLVISIALSCIPVFVLGISAQIVFGVRLDWLPVAGISDGWPLSYLLPSLVIALFGLASVSRLVR